MKKVCKIKGCAKPVDCRGWCVAHYTRWLRYKNPLMVRRTPSRELRNFLEKAFTYKKKACLEWPFGKTHDGYPIIKGCGVAHGTYQLGERNPYAKLTEKIVKRIRSAKSRRGLAEKYGVSQAQINRVISRESWGWLN